MRGFAASQRFLSYPQISGDCTTAIRLVIFWRGFCWSRRDFAAAAGLSETTDRRAECWQPVRVKAASKIGAAFGINPRTIAQMGSQAREA
jgi:hypothetical protein